VRPTATCLFVCLSACLSLLLACSSGDDDEPESSALQQSETQSETPDGDAGAGPAPPPDAGTATGHGGDPARIVVPANDATPPTATVALAPASDGRTLAEASQPGGTDSAAVELSESRLRGTTIGEDSNGGVSRVRISIAERITCQGAGGRRFERLRTRYFPPPEVERIKAQPGVRLPTRLMRSRVLALGGDRCGAGARPSEVHGELWGQVINSHGLEAVTPHIRFVYRR
jgi:hypothetical protein